MNGQKDIKGRSRVLGLF